jgi:hypothetical protein
MKCFIDESNAKDEMSLQIDGAEVRLTFYINTLNGLNG